MNSYAIYRIAETIRVLLFMTLSILVFNFYPVTAVMIVLLALLNDGAILSIAYDRVRYSKRARSVEHARACWASPRCWASLGVVASFGLFYLAERVFELESPSTIQSLIYLKLSVAGPSDDLRRPAPAGRSGRSAPAPILLWAVVGTQVVATLIAVYGVVHGADRLELGRGCVWGYALVWFLVERPGQAGRLPGVRSDQAGAAWAKDGRDGLRAGRLMTPRQRPSGPERLAD